MDMGSNSEYIEILIIKYYAKAVNKVHKAYFKKLVLINDEKDKLNKIGESLNDKDELLPYYTELDNRKKEIDLLNTYALKELNRKMNLIKNNNYNVYNLSDLDCIIGILQSSCCQFKKDINNIKIPNVDEMMNNKGKR